MKKTLILTILLYILLPIYSAQAEPEIWQVIIAEAVGEGYEGMYAVACVIRNRGGDISGFCGGRRKDLENLSLMI